MEGTTAASTAAPAAAPNTTPNGAAQAATSTPKPVALPADKAAKTQTAKTEAPVGTGKDVAEKPAEKEAEPEYEFKSRGKMRKAPLSEILRLASLSDGAYEKYEESAKKEKEAEAKLSRIKTPRDAMSFLTDPNNGYKPEEVREVFEEWYANTFIAPEQMTPEQRRIAELEKRNKAYEEAEEKRKAEADAEESKRLDETASKTIQDELKKTLEESGLEKNRFNMSRIAYWIRVNEAKGISAPRDMIIQQVKNEFNGILKQAVKSANGDAAKLISVLGDDVVKIIRKYDIEQLRLKRGGGKPPESPEKTERVPDTSKKEKISVAEVRRRARLFK